MQRIGILTLTKLSDRTRETLVEALENAAYEIVFDAQEQEDYDNGESEALYGVADRIRNVSGLIADGAMERAVGAVAALPLADWLTIRPDFLATLD